MTEITKKQQGWLLPDRRKTNLLPGLYLVATPIGNLGDMSLRALDTLAAVDRVMCEDTRVTGKLLKHFGISKPLSVYNDHSDTARRDKVMAAIAEGQAVALVSDAGMPLVSDPGLKLVQACGAAGLRVSSVPGASATLMGLQLSGLASDAFSFIGFLPSKEKARRDVLARWAGAGSTLVAFETAPRLLKALGDIVEVLGDPEVAVARELTKMYEEIRRGRASEVLAHYEAEGTPKGEIVLVIGPRAHAEMSEDDLRAALAKALLFMGTKEAAAHVAQVSGRTKKDLYRMAVEMKA